MGYKKELWIVGGIATALSVLAFVFLGYLGIRLFETHQVTNFLTIDYQVEDIDEQAARVGNTLGSLVGIRIAVVAAVLTFIGAIFTFIAFYIQYIANRMQQGQFKEQRDDMARERFENKFFAMLNIYRDIVQAMDMEGVGTGKRAFHFMFFEFKALYVRMWKLGLLKSAVNGSEDTGEEYPGQRRRERILKVAFNLFINGVGTVNQRIEATCEGLILPEELACIIKEIQEIQRQQEENGGVFMGNVPYLGDYKGKKFSIFDGHRLRLVSYFRQVYVIMHYLFEQDEKFLSRQDKNFYLNVFCSQMSEHEIGLIKAYDSSDEWVTVQEECIKEVFLVFPFHDTLNWDNGCFFS